MLIKVHRQTNFVHEVKEEIVNNFDEFSRVAFSLTREVVSIIR